LAAVIASWCNAERVASDALQDRGLRYGDGVFETIPLWRGEPLYRREHATRLRRGISALRLPKVDFDCAIAPALALAPERAVLRLSVHATGGRGYQRDESAVATWLQLSEWRNDPWRDVAALRLRWCQWTLPLQPALAGIKHLNRLDQVMARREWRDPRIHEGLLCDANGDVIEGVASNLFIVQNGQLATPLLDRCGVAGVLRQRIIDRLAPAIVERRLSRADVLAADEVFVCNSLRGIRPVTRIGAQRFEIGSHTQALLGKLRRQRGAAFYDDQGS
jgi:4-amino-4-deoxychorismate lyase